MKDFWTYLSTIQKASLITAALGFVIRLSTTVTSGGVTAHRDWAALVLGGLAILLGVMSAPGVLSSAEHRKEKLLALLAAIVVGAIHIARGIGALQIGTLNIP